MKLVEIITNILTFIAGAALMVLVWAVQLFLFGATIMLALWVFFKIISLF
jgi:phosphate starvation-inducible membrane PsiE